MPITHVTHVQKPDGSTVNLSTRVFGQDLFFEVSCEKDIYFGQCYANHNGDGRRLLASASLSQSQIPAGVDPSLYLYGFVTRLLRHFP